jgi:diketogulonate reductase-like aldo/keto reductase
MGEHRLQRAIPRLGLGTWQLEGAACRQAVCDALELGYRAIDTAQGYANEAEVGVAIVESGVPREEVFLTTKVWPDSLVADPTALVEESLERLRVERIDLLLLHWPSPALGVEQTAAALRVPLELGLVRYVGVSNFPVAYLERAVREAPIACNQIELHPYLRQPHLMARAAELGVQIVAYSPLARGRVTQDAQLRAMGARHGKSAAQVALRWLLQNPDIALVVKASSRSRLAENLRVFDFALDADEVAAIDALARGLRLLDPPFAPPWDHE